MKKCTRGCTETAEDYMPLRNRSNFVSCRLQSNIHLHLHLYLESVTARMVAQQVLLAVLGALAGGGSVLHLAARELSSLHFP
mmetsp:Transcript_34988/g.47269  ORF Transcript_34988/g.47269 Transcript_34988/m.47269 type:complete len:82 (+) Transcript_34988:294-539(+)